MKRRRECRSPYDAVLCVSYTNIPGTNSYLHTAYLLHAAQRVIEMQNVKSCTIIFRDSQLSYQKNVGSKNNKREINKSTFEIDTVQLQ